ncbi:MAG: hypothetical protein IJ438_05845 [Clostridia bacterium]|nr:hypothetical protein [Clostridia bacterium]
MKVMGVLRQSAEIYRKNWVDLMLALLLELALRGICLAPMLFLCAPGLEWLALLCVPLYLLIILPARENYALALQDMLSGGRVFSTQLVCPCDYGKKLLRGLKGTLCMLLWSALPIAGISLAVAAYLGMVDFFTLLRILDQIGGGSSVDGIIRVVLIIAATLVLPVIGCAVHCGGRHSAALGHRKLVKGHRVRLVALWAAGLVTLLPFVLVVLATIGNYIPAFVSQLKDSLTSGIVFEPLGVRAYILAGAVAVLLLPVLPFKNMLPAVYLRKAKEERYAAP